MFLTEKTSGYLVEIINSNDLFNPYRVELVGRYNCGEEAQDPDKFKKTNLSFLSGEDLPRCWTDPHYRDHEINRKHKRSELHRSTHH